MVIAAVAAALLPATAHAGPSPDSAVPVPDVSVSKEAASAQQIRAHWTPERLRQAAAHPAPLRPARSTDHRRTQARTATRTPHLTATADAVLPRTGPARASVPTQLMADEIPVSQRVPFSSSWPNVIVGRLFYDEPTGKSGSCTASVIVSDTKNALWTAAHCVHLGDGSGDAGWFKNIAFVPGYKDGQMPWGMWSADREYAPTSWTQDGDQFESDLAAVILKPDTNPDTQYGNIEDAIGGLGYVFGETTDHDNALSYGYPGDGYQRPDSDFAAGEFMMFCGGNVEDAADFNPIDDRLKMDCDMGHGASGGPMFIGLTDFNPQIIGANSHFESDANDNRISDDLFSSEHDNEAVAVINTVNDSA